MEKMLSCNLNGGKLIAMRNSWEPIVFTATTKTAGHGVV
jgi:hypothetical protein